MWTQGWRERVFGELAGEWDLVVIGGGITGAGVLLDAARRGLRVLMVEQKDFAWGSSSRSSKLVHGGLRYMKEGQFGLTRACVAERDRLLAEEPALVTPLGFLVPGRRQDRSGRWMLAAGLLVYDAICGRHAHRRVGSPEVLSLAPHLDKEDLLGGFRYRDAQTDDSRLVLRIIQRAMAHGAVALNYASADGLLRADGKVAGIVLRDGPTGRTFEVKARVVINASGAWADQVRAGVQGERRLRPLRGSHLVFPSWRLPLSQAVAFPHPKDRRMVFAVPWESVTLVGTTDVDHGHPLDQEPHIDGDETEYLLQAAVQTFPTLGLSASDVTATFAGVRPVISSGQEVDPSRESRDHAIWVEEGLLTVTGGKLTTFQLVASDALAEAAKAFPDLFEGKTPRHVAHDLADPLGLDDPWLDLRLRGRFGEDAKLIASFGKDELTAIEQTPTAWAELRWAARAEGVLHLDDLLLRRTRLGLLLPGGGVRQLGRIRALCQAELGWDDGKWAEEARRYTALWHRAYAPPGGEAFTAHAA